MRWHEQIAERDRETRLPGFTEVVTRTFDAPEALETRFHEIHAKSALNRVPGASKLPFGWTVNPYRGCVHACTFCAGGETPILMADGCTRPLETLSVGDAVGERRPIRRLDRRPVVEHPCPHVAPIPPANDGSVDLHRADHEQGPPSPV